MAKNISRANFLKTAGTSLAGLALLPLASCAQKENGEKTLSLSGRIIDVHGYDPQNQVATLRIRCDQKAAYGRARLAEWHGYTDIAAELKVGPDYLPLKKNDLIAFELKDGFSEVEKFLNNQGYRWYIVNETGHGKITKYLSSETDSTE